MYVSTGTYDYTNIPEASSLPTDIQQYQSSDIVNTHASQIPFSSLSTSNIDATVPDDVQSSGNNYYQYKTLDTQDVHFSSNPYEYTTGQTGLSSTDYIQQSAVQQQQQVPNQFVQDQGIYTHASNTFDYPQETTQAHLSNYDYHSTEQQQAYQYPYSVDTSQQEQKQTSDYYQPQATSTSESQTQAGYSQPTGTFEYTRESYQSEKPIYNYQSADHQTSQYSYNGGDTQQVPQQDAYNYASTSQTLDSSSQDLSSTDYFQQQQSTGSFDYTANTLQTQIPTYNYQNIEQQSYQYPYNTSNVEQQTYNYASGTNIDAFVPTEANIQNTDQNQAYNYSNQGFDSSNYYQQQLAPSSTSQIQGAYGQPTGTFEYSRESYQSQQPIYNYQGSDQQSSQYSYNVENLQGSQSQDTYNYTPQLNTVQQTGQNQTYDYSQQVIGSADQYQQQPVSQTDHSRAFGQRLSGGSIPTGTVEYTRQSYYSQEPVLDNYSTETFIQQQESQSSNVNDYLTRFGSELSSQSTRGPFQSSDDRQSTTTVTTTPFIVQQQHANLTSPEGAIQTYDLQNYTNESTVSETIQPPFTSTTSYEEGHQHLLPQSEQYTEKEVSLNDTYNSLPPPPLTTQETVHQQGAYVTNVSDFPPPPPPDHHTYQTGHTQAPVIPSTLSSDQQTDDDTQEDEEIFDLHQCIAKCYSKYQQSWNQEEQRKYEEQIRNIPQSAPTTDYHQTSLNTGERLSQNVITQSDNVQYKYDDKSTKDLPIDSRSQQTIEYSPPLITQAKPTITTIPPSVPSSSYSYIQGEQQQQQQIPVYDHASPVPPHLSFNDADYQPNLYFSSQITAQPRQHQNISIDTDEQQRRYRAHSEPASIKQDSVTSVPPIQPPSQVFEDQTRRAISIPMINRAPIHLLDQGRAYETEAELHRRVPRIDPKTGLCLVPCPMAQKYAHLPPHLRPELFCIELPPPSTLPPVPPPPPPRPVQQQQRWCVRCCCVPGQSLVKKVVYRQAEGECHSTKLRTISIFLIYIFRGTTARRLRL